jgi:HEAT repeat protein
MAGLEPDIVKQHDRARWAGDWQALIRLLKPQRAVELNARILKTIGEIADPKSGAAVADYLKRDARVAVQWKGAEALGRIGDPRAIPVLRTMVLDSDAPVIYAAVEALGELGGEEALEALRRAPRRNRLVRMRLATALGKIGGSHAVEMLAELARDPMASVRHRAFEALVKIGSPSAADVLDQALPRTWSPIWHFWVKRNIRKMRAA